VMIGRRYALAYFSTAHGLRSDLGPKSDPTGPSGAAQAFRLSGLPKTNDDRVDILEIYAYPDGDPDGGVPRLVGTTDATAPAIFILDEKTEDELAGSTAYPGASQPTRGGEVIITVTQDGGEWFKLSVAPGATKSFIADGLGLNPIALGAQVNVDFENDTGETVDIQVVLE
jgi:hypothetical protein